MPATHSPPLRPSPFGPPPSSPPGPLPLLTSPPRPLPHCRTGEGGVTGDGSGLIAAFMRATALPPRDPDRRLRDSRSRPGLAPLPGLLARREKWVRHGRGRGCGGDTTFRRGCCCRRRLTHSVFLRCLMVAVAAFLCLFTAPVVGGTETLIERVRWKEGEEVEEDADIWSPVIFIFF